MTDARVAPIVACICLALSGCGGMEDAFGIADPFAVPKPFDQTSLTARPVGVQPQPIAIYPVVGLKGRDAKTLQDAILERSNDSDVLAVSPDAPRPIALRGLLRRESQSPVVEAVFVRWFVVDPDGKEMASFDVEDSWTRSQDAIKDLTLPAAAAKSIANKTIEKLEAALSPGSPNTPRSATTQRASDVGSPELPVFIGPLKGAPGDGNQSLQRALSAILDADPRIALVTTPEKARAIINGEAKLSHASAKEDKIELAWQVTTASGSELGKITQANTVPRGSLDSRWGQSAIDAAQAASEGIIDLFGRLESARQ